MITSIEIIPATEIGERLHPVNYAVPKELFPVSHHAVINWVIVEAKKIGCSYVVDVVTTRNRLIREHITNYCSSITSNIGLHFLYNEPKDVGHVILCAAADTNG